MARRLRAIVAPERVAVIPNMVDVAAIAQTIAERAPALTGGQPFLLYVGKLEYNKGAHELPAIMAELVRQSGRPAEQLPPLMVAGDGSLRSQIERELTRLGTRSRFLDWAEHDDVLALMAHCDALLYPSGWGEPLTRVLLEACACGAPAVAMPTGGTPDIIVDGVSGFLEPTPAGLARRALQLIEQPRLRQRMREAARTHARLRFSTEAVAGHVEQLYYSLTQRS
jgi:glycosyltransferase involved in cell wall biosynthesis